MMMHGGHGDRGGVEIEIGGEEILHRGIDRDAVLRLRLCGARGVRLESGDKLDACSGILELAVDAEMVAPEGSAACHGYTQLGPASDATLPFLRRP